MRVVERVDFEAHAQAAVVEGERLYGRRRDLRVDLAPRTARADAQLRPVAEVPADVGADPADVGVELADLDAACECVDLVDLVANLRRHEPARRGIDRL